MLGAIIGDMVGSIYEFDPIESKKFNIYDERMFPTDDSLLTLCVAKVLINHFPIDYKKESLDLIKKDLIKEFSNAVYENPNAGFGGSFYRWAKKVHLVGYAEPYNSCGNGSAMRISPVGWTANSIEEVKILSKAVTEITHNHIEGIKGAEAVAIAIYLARIGQSKEEIKEYIVNNYYPEIVNFNYEDLVKNYQFTELAQDSVPQAIYCFLISTSYEDAIRNCVGIGGDCDTTGAMAGAIAEAYYNKDTISDFEKYFLDQLIPSNVKIITDLFNFINNPKYKNYEY